jgi:hypothetical protein
MADIKNICVVALVMAILAMIVRTVESILTMGYYLDPAYFQLWSKLMMPTAGPPPMSFFLFSFVLAFISWALFAYVYGILGGAFKKQDYLTKGLSFGILVFMVSTFPGALMNVLLLNLPAGLIISWTITGLILSVTGGVIAAKLIKV